MPKRIQPKDWVTAHNKARKVKPALRCERCGSKKSKLHVHHKDLNWRNNSEDNLQVLCQKCHGLAHRKEKPVCRIGGCDRPVRGLKLCSLHYQRLRRHGDPDYVVPRTRSLCRLCGLPAQAKQLCHRHYTYYSRANHGRSHLRKVRCSNGHEFTPENTIYSLNSYGTPQRSCRACRLEYQKRYYREKRVQSKSNH